MMLSGLGAGEDVASEAGVNQGGEPGDNRRVICSAAFHGPEPWDLYAERPDVAAKGRAAGG
jgi:hypothetical protein